ncbi:zinc finger FYVE domain-containing protein 9-like isoform X5 [Penaeus chinensis]|uniref:zinc finger FYVE domain-containing protein 9-like isoform X5 n=1 Tax=Penaeus chinensis TaxID=139456 RepID=UPI001FB6DD9A|nr:zinc finger FYVE domain-containing protein 9-like isoform X5 [Penaeus chinensis]
MAVSAADMPPNLPPPEQSEAAPSEDSSIKQPVEDANSAGTEVQKVPQEPNGPEEYDGNVRVGDLVPEEPGSLEEKNLVCGGLDVIASRPLDVVPASVPPDRGLASGHETRHPDIIDVWQSGVEGGAMGPPTSVTSSLMGTEQSENIDSEYDERGRVVHNVDHSERENSVEQQEHRLLPDLMSMNSVDSSGTSEGAGCVPDYPEPAIVMENALSDLQMNEPAIVMESQSCSRIPEVVNVHQTAEQQGYGENQLLVSRNTVSSPSVSNTVSQAPTEEGATVNDVPGILQDHVSPVCDNVDRLQAANALDSERLESQATSQGSLPDVSDVNPAPVTFSKDVAIDDADLDAELAELEEEQFRLQGAYGGNTYQSKDLAGSSCTENSKTDAAAVGSDVQQLPDSALVEGLDLIDSMNATQSGLRSDVQESTGDAQAKEGEAETLEAGAADWQHENNKEEEKEATIGAKSVLEAQGVSLSQRSEVGGVEEVICQPQSSDMSAQASSNCHTGHVMDNSGQTSKYPEGDGGDNLSNNSTGTDTMSSSSTLTDGDLGSPERQPQQSQPTPESPSRVTPGTLVTAVYDDDSGSGREDDGNNDDGGASGGASASGAVGASGHGGGMVVGHYAPFWIPDEDAPYCQECGQKFTVIRRRHHCRACGRVLCAQCCHDKAPLPYMEYKEARVCGSCLQLIQAGLEDEPGAAARSSRQSSDSHRRPPDPNNPMEYCSRVPPPQQVASTSVVPPPTVMVPVGVLKREEYVFEDNPDSSKLEEQMRGDGPPVVFAVHKNLTVLVKMVKLECCVGVEVWNIATRGLCTVGQEEMVVLLEVAPGEAHPPRDIFAFFHTVYQQANQGNLVTELGHTIFTEPEGFLGSREHGGFLYIRPTFQCLRNLVLPPSPYIFAVLIQKWETPWAKVFPLRLMLRMGAEFRYYPCPLVSTRNRKPVFCEIGHTIMNLLVDFRNYAYTVPAIEGFVIHMEDKKTSLLFPKNRYEQVAKALSNSNDHVLALGANFSPQADSHLVTIENDDGHYSTQAINIHNRPRKVTGASFIVFNGALKTTSGLSAKSSIVEDGLMVQIPADMMTKLREALRNMKNFDIPCGPISTSMPDEVVSIEWTSDDKNFNVGKGIVNPLYSIKSPVDEKQMDGIPSVKIHSGTDYVSNAHLIRWTEVFIMQGETNNSSDVNLSRLSEVLARAFCVALTPHLSDLYLNGHSRLGLRATVHQDNVGYEAGSSGNRLPAACMNDLDMELIPVIHRAAANITDQPIILELVFHIMEQ